MAWNAWPRLGTLGPKSVVFFCCWVFLIPLDGNIEDVHLPGGFDCIVYIHVYIYSYTYIHVYNHIYIYMYIFYFLPEFFFTVASGLGVKSWLAIFVHAWGYKTWFPVVFFGPSWCDSTAETVRSPSDPPNFPAQSSIHVACCFGSRELGWFGKRHAFWGSIGVDEGAWYLGRSQGKLSFCVKWKLDEKMTFHTSNTMVTTTTRIAFHLPSSIQS